MKNFCESCTNQRREQCEAIRAEIRGNILGILEADSDMLELEIREFSALSIPHAMRDRTVQLGMAALGEFREIGCSFGVEEIVFATQEEITSVSSEFVRNLAVTIAIDEEEDRIE